MKRKPLLEKKKEIDPQIAWQRQVIREEMAEYRRPVQYPTVNASAGTASRPRQTAP